MQEAVPRSGRAWPARNLELATLVAIVRAWRLPSAALASTLPALVELSILFAWTLVITRPYLNFDPMVVPAGREYLSAIQTHHLWTAAAQCGWCALWNGSERGGGPAFADIHGSMLHPIVIITTLLWGVLNGSKVGLIASFFMGGVAQWWLASVLGLGRVARLWSAGVAVAAGHLSARMELGAFGVVLSTAACALVLPALVTLCRAPTRHRAVVLGIVVALAVLAGQGYMQVGLALAAPAAVVLLPRDWTQLRQVGKQLGIATGLALLLAAPLLVPFLHFLPLFTKETDPAFKSAQPFTYVPLNLVIDDFKYYTSDALRKFPYPHLYAHFVGWVPVLLAVYGLHVAANGRARREATFLAFFALLAFWISSAVPLEWLTAHLATNSWLAQQLAGVRHPPQIAGLAIPPILALAALGLDELLRHRWPTLTVALAPALDGRQANGADGGAGLPPFTLHLSWIVAVPLLLSLLDVRAFSAQWIGTARLAPDVPQVLEALKTPTLEWVNPPFGEHFWIEAAVGMGLKLNQGIQTWRWRDRPLPDPVLEANRAGPPPGMTLKMVVAGVPIYAPENPVAAAEREYATVRSADGQLTICEAHGLDGNIDVVCAVPQAGLLTVKENSWTGWHVAIDGRPATLRPGRWLAVDLPAGSHTITFRYRPWDVPVGLALLLVGILMALWCWLSRDSLAPVAGRKADGRHAPAEINMASHPETSSDERETIAV